MTKTIPSFSQGMIAFLLDTSEQTLISTQVESVFAGSDAELYPPGKYHVTLVSFGPTTYEDVVNIRRSFEYHYPSRVDGFISGAGYFQPSDGNEKVAVLHFDSPAMYDARDSFFWRLRDLGIDADKDHNFSPHITVAKGSDMSSIGRLNFNRQPLVFNDLYLVVDDLAFKLGEQMPRSAEQPMKSFEILEDGNLAIDVIGVPFGGPAELEGKDLDGEYFSAETDIGPLEKALCYWDHAKISDDPAYSKVSEFFGQDLLGEAHRLEKTDAGWVYRIIIDRTKKYAKLLEELAKQRLLKASSTPFQRTVQKDADGHWKRWHVVEVALTITPANPLAAQLEKALEELNLGELSVGKNTEKNTPEEQITEQPTEQNPVEETDLEKQIADSFVAAPEGDGDGEGAVEKSLAEQVADLQTINAQILENQEKMVKALEDIKTAFPALGKHITTLVRGGERRNAQTPLENDVEKVLQQQTPSNNGHRPSYIPTDAPGL